MLDFNKEKRDRYADAYMKVAYVFAEMSYCNRSKVGSIIVKDGNIISHGWNGTPAGFPNLCETQDNKTKIEVLHAEANAIAKLAQSNESGADAVLFTTTAPCIECAKLIVQTGIKAVFYAEEYDADSREEGKVFLERCEVKVFKHGD